MKNVRRVSIVVPFYNEGEGVARFHASLGGLLRQLAAFACEVICVDDGSTDDTLARLIAVAEADPRFEVVELSRNFGKEAAMTAGLDIATGDAVVVMDADLQDPPELVPRMVGAWIEGAEVVLAHRTDRAADGFLKRASAGLFYRIHNRFSTIAIPENVGDFRLMDRSVVEALKRLPEQQRFMKGLFAWVGFRTVVLDYARQPRRDGGSKFSGWKLWNFALEGITSFSTAPLKLWSYLGALGALGTFSYGVFIVLRTLIHGVDVPGYASLLVAVLFVGSLQLLSVGILGEYIGRIYMESKRRPVYVIRRRYGGRP